MCEVLSAFTLEERTRAHRLLAARVAHMGGRKFEEGDWADIYCGAKGIPLRGWSNLSIDVAHGDLGVEHKMMAKVSSKPITYWCGTSLMHPSLTRAIRIESVRGDPNEVMRDVFDQYNALLNRRIAAIEKEEGATGSPDMRTGWLLWQDSLREFLYFEERMKPYDSDQFRAKWVENPARGNRRGSTNLWIYDKETDKKRFSVTTQAGIKIQPYFDVPAHDNPNLYVFTVQGERMYGDMVRVWLTAPTATELSSIVGSLDPQILSDAILSADLSDGVEVVEVESDSVQEIFVSGKAYDRLYVEDKNKSDESRFRSLVSRLRVQS
jgi:hypothetical protein